MTKYLLILPITLSILLLGLAVVNAQPMSAPKLYAVNFYADWCGKCKVLDPEFEKALEQGGWNESQIKFLTMDLTDKVRIGKSVQFAKDQGVYEALKANGSKTGSIALLDGTTKEELTRFFAGDDAEKIEKVIAEKLAQEQSQ